MTYLHTEQYGKESNKASARYHWILCGGALLPSISQGCVDPNFTKPGKDIGQSWLHKKFVSEFGYLAAFSNTRGSKLSDLRVMLKTMPNFTLFTLLPLCKN